MGKKERAKGILKNIYKVVSYVSFVILIIVGISLVYYLVMTKIYEKTQNEKYLPVFSLYTIISPSMVPAINVYDVVVDGKVTEDTILNQGDVITFYSRVYNTNNLTVTHRISQKIETNGEIKYITKGDNNQNEDSGYVYPADIVGKVLFKIPQLGRVQFLVASKGGWLVIVLIPALGVIIYDVVKILKMLKVNKKLDKITSDEEKKKIKDKKKNDYIKENQNNLKKELLEKHVGAIEPNDRQEEEKPQEKIELPKKIDLPTLKSNNNDDDIFLK